MLENFIIIKLRSRKNENYSESYIFEIYMYVCTWFSIILPLKITGVSSSGNQI